MIIAKNDAVKCICNCNYMANVIIIIIIGCRPSTIQAYRKKNTARKKLKQRQKRETDFEGMTKLMMMMNAIFCNKIINSIMPCLMSLLVFRSGFFFFLLFLLPFVYYSNLHHQQRMELHRRRQRN